MASPFFVELPELSEDEAIALAIASGIPKSSPEFGAYLRYIQQAYADTIEPMAEAEREALLKVVQGTPSKETLQAITDKALSNSKALITNVTRAELSKIHEQTTEATSLGLGPREVARRLEAVKGLDSNRAKSYQNFVADLEAQDLPTSVIERQAEAYYNKLLRDRKLTIASTEMREGTSQVHRIEAEERGAKYKVWQTTGDDRVSDECQANEAQGPIPVDEAFSSGVDHSPEHPNCRCTVSYITSDAVAERSAERAQARAERTAAAKSE